MQRSSHSKYRSTPPNDLDHAFRHVSNSDVKPLFSMEVGDVKCLGWPNNAGWEFEKRFAFKSKPVYKYKLFKYSNVVFTYILV